MGNFNLNPFLPHTSIYTDTDKEQFLSDLTQISQKNKFSFLEVTDSGRVTQSKNIFHWLYHQFQGLRGNFDGTNRDLIQYQTVKIISEGIQRGWIEPQKDLIEQAVLSVKKQNGKNTPELEKVITALVEPETSESSAAIQDYYFAHRAELIPKKWTPNLLQQDLVSILKNHYLFKSAPDQVDEVLQPSITELKEFISEMQSVLKKIPMSEKTFQTFLELEEKIWEIEDKILELVQPKDVAFSKISENLKLSPSVRKDWSELYVLTKSLIQWRTNYRDMLFYKQVAKQLSEQTPSPKETINTLEKCALFSFEQLFQLNRYIRNPEDFFKETVLVPTIKDGLIQYTERRPAINSSSFETDITLVVPNLLGFTRGEIMETLKPMKAIEDALVQLGFSKYRVEEIMTKVNDLMKREKDIEATLMLIEAIKNEDARLATSQDCRQKLLEILKENCISGARDETTLIFDELMDDFPKEDDFTREEWNQLMEIKFLKWRSLLIEKSKTSKTWPELLEPVIKKSS